jgi:MFS family permease
MICFIVYIAADIALAFQNNYIALIILRMLQSAGSSGTVALANAVVADVATSAERGIYIGITSLTGILAPSLGPILGGIISQYAGWHWIFGFLGILAGVYFVPLLLFFPETGRNIVGDGTIPPPKWNRSFMNHVNEKKRLKEGIAPDYAERDALAAKRRVRFPNPLATLVVATEKEAACILFFAGIVYAGFFAVISALPSQMRDIYGYSDLVIGLVYLPIAGGSLIAAFANGRLIDWSYAREARKLGIPVVKKKQQDMSKFPIERARLNIAMPTLVSCSVFTIAYGWVLQARTNIAGPCVMLFFLGYTLIASTQSISVLIVDINPKIAGTATAAFNLVRCLLGAGSTALILPMESAMGTGWAFTFIGLLYVVLSPMLLVVMRWGPGWREKRWLKDEKKRKEKEERIGDVDGEKV